MNFVNNRKTKRTTGLCRENILGFGERCLLLPVVGDLLAEYPDKFTFLENRRIQRVETISSYGFIG